MAENVLNAMRGVTQYLMAENARIEEERKEKNINLAADRVADAYRRLGPNPTLEEIRSIQFRTLSDAAHLGAIKETIPLINQMQQSTLSMYEYNKNLARENATRGFIEDRMNVDLPDNIDPMQAATFMRQGETNEKMIDNSGKTWSVIFDDQGREKSKRLVNALGTEEQLSILDKQEGIKHKYDMKKLYATHSLQNKTTTTGGLAPDIKGFKWLKGYEGQTGEVLYTDAKGKGMYALQPNGTLVFYSKNPKKSQTSQKDIKDVISNLNDITDTFKDVKVVKLAALLNLTNGTKVFENLTGREIDEDANGNPTATNIGSMDEIFLQGNWEKKLSKAISDAGLKKDKHMDQINSIWDNVKSLKKAYDREQSMSNETLGLDNSEYQATKEETINGMGISEWNAGNQFISEAFTGSNPEVQAGIQAWILKQSKVGLGLFPIDAITYDDYLNLPSAKQTELINIIKKFQK